MLTLASFAALVSCDKGKENTTEAQSSPAESEAQSESESLSETVSDNGGDSSEGESDTDEGETTCYHPYAATLEGHWKPACSVCGKKDGKMQDHEFEQVIEDEGDLWLYSFVCSVCEFAASEQEVPYEINSFYSAGELTTLESSGALKGSVGFGAGIGFAKFSAEKGGSVTVKVLSGAEATFPSGSYLVMKVRLGASQSGFSASIKSSAASGAYTMNFSGLKSGWATIIVDITKAVQTTTDSTGAITVKGYAPDAFDNYYLTDFSFSGKASAGESFDVSYIMFCDTLKDAEAFVEGDMNVYLYKDIINESPDAEEKVCVDENGNPIIHEYIPGENGHSLLEGCTQCGLEPVTDEPHNFVQMEIDGQLTYACSACKWSRFGLNINKYFTAQDITSMATTYYQIQNNGVVEEGLMSFASFAGKGNTAQVIFSRDNSVSSDIEKAAAFNVGKANLFIIKIRTNTPAVSFAISFRSAVSGATQTTLEFPLKMTDAGEWATYVVDLSTVIPGAFVADENGNFTVGTFYYHIGYKDFTPDVKYDIEYMAFVDAWDEVKALVEEETVVNVTGSGKGQLIVTADRSCVGEHAYTTTKTNDGWKLICASCGKVEKDFGVESSIEKYMPAEILKDVRTDSDGKIDLEFMEEDGQSFIRLSNLIPNKSGWMGLTFTSGESRVTGQYMIMKVRLGENGLGTSYLAMYTGTTVGLKAEGQAVSVKMVEDGEWHYIVIDLASRIGDPSTYMVPNEDGTYTVKYLQMRPFSGTQCFYGTDEEGNKTYPQRVMEDDYLDIAYIAYCDSLDDIKDIIDVPSYEWSVSIGENSVKSTSDHSCVTHSVSVELTGNTQKIVCQFCKTVIRNFTVPEEINWYSEFSAANTYKATVAKEMYDDINGIVFNRFTGTGGGHLNITGGSGSGAETAGEFKTGKYLVLKYRSTDAQMILRIGTKNEAAYYTALGDYQKDAPGDEWQVAVLSLKTVTAFANDPDGMTPVYFMITTDLMPDAAGYTVDIAYAAIVDSLDEMRLLLENGEDYYYYGDKFNSDPVLNGGSDEDDGGDTPDPTPTPDPAPTDGICETDNTAYSVFLKDSAYVYGCQTCGHVEKQYSVSAEVEKYLPAETLKNVRTDSDGKIDLDLMTENGESFIRLSNLIPNTSGWMGLTFVNGNTTVTGQYMIMKVRLGENGLGTNHMELYTGTTSGLKGGGQGASFKMAEDGEWHYVVIDLAKCISDPDTYMIPNDDGTYTIKYLQIRPFSGTQCYSSTDANGGKVYEQRVMADDYLDIAFIAFFDSLDELGEMVDSETYEWSVSKTLNAVRNTADHSCVTHDYGVEKNGTNYTVSCAGCNTTFRSFTVSEDVNWISSLDQMTQYAATPIKNQFDPETFELYTRFTGKSQTHLNPVGGSGAGTWTADKYQSGQYLVIKYRAEGGKFTVNIATKDFGAASANEPNRPKYSSVGALSGGDTMSDWQIAVIKIPEGKNYTVSSEQELGFMILTDGAAYTFDIAYIAVVDSLDELSGLLEEGESYVDYGDSFSNEGTVVAAPSVKE